MKSYKNLHFRRFKLLICYLNFCEKTAISFVIRSLYTSQLLRIWLWSLELDRCGFGCNALGVTLGSFLWTNFDSEVTLTFRVYFPYDKSFRTLSFYFSSSAALLKICIWMIYLSIIRIPCPTNCIIMSTT